MKRKNMKKRNSLMLLAILILAVTVGYALLTTTLNINGTSKIKNAKWDIHWENPQVLEGSVTNTLPTIDSLKTTASFDVTLNIPGDYYEFTIDAKNDGTIDGEISTIKTLYNNAEISETNKLPVFIDYTVTDDEGGAIEVGQRLNVDESKKYKVKVTYKKDIENGDLPQEEVTLSLKYQVTYVQAADSNVQPVGGGTAIDTIIGKSSPTTSTSEAVAIQHHATDQTPAVTDYRYMGADPNNYVYFNCTTDDPEEQNSTTCETWRAIGVVDGKVKLIRTQSLAEQTYNTANNTNFAQTSIKGNIDTYYNTLQDSAKAVIDTSTWYLGTWYGQPNRTDWLNDYGDEYEDNGYDQLPEGAYIYERSTLTSDDGYPTTYTGNMALPYPSDYAFASSVCYSTCPATGANEAACQNFSEIYHLTYPEDSYEYNEQTDDYEEVPGKNYGAPECTNSNWMYTLSSTHDTWFITSFGPRIAWGTWYGKVMFLDSGTSYPHTSGANVTIYLKPTAKFEGDGTSANPYRVVE